MAAKRNGKREPIAVHGAFVRSVTVGCMVVIETTRQVYITHRDWIPALDAITAARVRAAWAQGALTIGELAAMAGVEHGTIDKCVRGTDNFSHLPPVTKGAAFLRRPVNVTVTVTVPDLDLPWAPALRCDERHLHAH